MINKVKQEALTQLADMPQSNTEKHDMDPPERWCLGDDPCVCQQIWMARQDERAAAVQRVEALAYQRSGGVWDSWLVDLGSIREAIRGES
jgi:hypothetical protein